MKTKMNNYFLVVLKMTLIRLIIFSLIMPLNTHNSTTQEIDTNNNFAAYNNVLLDEIISQPQVIEEVASYNKIFDDNIVLIEFYANMYNIPLEIVREDLLNKSKNYNEYDVNNLGFVNDSENKLSIYENKDLGLIAYFEKFLKDNPKYKETKVVPYEGSTEYIEALIGYFTTVYTNVDYKVAIGIGAAETGYYKYKGALEKNNIFGGMSNGKLRRYNNMEYGVLSYIRLLSNNYFGKGLNTLESIGKYYCPVFNNGKRSASSHWISLVKGTMKKYDENKYNDITVVVQLNEENVMS